MLYWLKDYYIRRKGWLFNKRHDVYWNEEEDMVYLLPVSVVKRCRVLRKNDIKMFVVYAQDESTRCYGYITLEADKTSNDVIETIIDQIDSDPEINPRDKKDWLSPVFPPFNK